MSYSYTMNDIKDMICVSVKSLEGTLASLLLVEKRGAAKFGVQMSYKVCGNKCQPS